MSALEDKAVNVVRGLAMDGPHAASSGHQGTAMALAPLAHVLFSRVMRYDAAAPDWPDRDRFVLSCGHASILHYAMLHLTGYPLSLDDLRQFRQWGSATPGHPEVGHTPGIEVTTGPLGQGFANGVGLALAERWLRDRFGHELFDHHTYVLCSDGDLAEGVSHEAASFAGHQGLGRLICVYDDNHVSIDGPTELTLSDDAVRRFEAYGWHVLDLGESAEDLDRLEAALRDAAEVTDAPSLVVVRSHIGYPSPDFTDDPAAHGLPFDDQTIRRAKEVMGLPDEPFHIPDEVAEFYADAGRRGAERSTAWAARLADWSGDREALDVCLAGRGLSGWEQKLPTWSPGESLATRQACAKVLSNITDVVPGLVAGSADLTGNTGVKLDGAEPLTVRAPDGRQIHYGIREHAMGSIMNGMALHGGMLPVGGTFLVFSDYMRPAVRLAALSQAHVVFVWSHDSVGVGEDGPTHQPVEQIASLRAIPGLRVFRPADANETSHALRLAVDLDGPSALVTSRQGLPVLGGTAEAPVERGGYVLADTNGSCDVVLIGTGSEVAVCLDAAVQLADRGVAARVVSMPCVELFADQPADYRSTVLPAGVPALAVEAGVTQGWYRWADDCVGIDRFGASAPGATVLAELGINPDHVADRAAALASGSD